MLSWEMKPFHISSLFNLQKILKVRNDLRIQIDLVYASVYNLMPYHILCSLWKTPLTGENE